MFTEIIDVIIGGISNASVYALLAMGLSLIYGVSKIFNLAYGSLYSLAGYLAWFLFTLGLGYPLVFVITIPVMFFFGMGIDRALVRPLRSHKNWMILVCMATLGLALFLDTFDLVVFGPYLKQLPPFFEGSIRAGQFVISYTDIAIFIFSLIVIGALILFLNKTRMGMAIRAVSQDSQGAEIVGINHNTIFGITFGICTVVAGVGAILLASRYFVSYKVGWDILFKAWIITAFGGMGSLGGAAIAALVLAMVESFVFWKFGANITQIAWFVILVATFIVRPEGIRGSK